MCIFKSSRTWCLENNYQELDLVVNPYEMKWERLRISSLINWMTTREPFYLLGVFGFVDLMFCFVARGIRLDHDQDPMFSLNEGLESQNRRKEAGGLHHLCSLPGLLRAWFLGSLNIVQFCYSNICLSMSCLHAAILSPHRLLWVKICLRWTVVVSSIH